MTRVRRDGMEKRRQILEVAAALFSQKGYHETTIAEICGACGANIALVNYHFQNKETLYRLAWQRAHQSTLEKYPSDGDVPHDASPELKLRGRISALIRQNADPSCYDNEIWRKELATPTGLLAELRHRFVMPMRRDLSGIIKELLGERVGDREVRLATMSVIAQCRVPILKKDDSDPPFLDVDLNARIEHIWQFSMGGISRLKEHLLG